MTSTGEDGKKVVRYPLASTVSDMRPLTRVTPGSSLDPLRVACNKAFALACRYSGGHDLVEEMVASKCWPLGKYRPEFKLEKVKLPVFGHEDGVLFPHFNIDRAADKKRQKSFLMSSKRRARYLVIFLIVSILRGGLLGIQCPASIVFLRSWVYTTTTTRFRQKC